MPPTQAFTSCVHLYVQRCDMHIPAQTPEHREKEGKCVCVLPCIQTLLTCTPSIACLFCRNKTSRANAPTSVCGRVCSCFGITLPSKQVCKAVYTTRGRETWNKKLNIHQETHTHVELSTKACTFIYKKPHIWSHGDIRQV